MAISPKQAEFKQTKELAELILKINNQPYNDWLHKEHLKVIQENQETVVTALSAMVEDKN